MQTIRISNLDIAAAGDSANRICYILSPFDGLEEWIERPPNIAR